MKAVITVVGKDSVGILAKVSNECASVDVNIAEVSQSILNDMFCMIMIAEIDKAKVVFDELRKRLEKLGDENNLKIHCMHEDIFNSMHKI